MKGFRHKLVLGLVLGERSLSIAELAATGETREVRKTGEFAYPAGMGLDAPDALGKALGSFLKERGFTARVALVGLSARRLVVKLKEVPPADRATLNDILRIQAEGEFDAELKDLAYDYEGGTAGGVLLAATPRRDVDNAEKLCLAAGLTAAAVTSSALAIGAQACRTAGGECLVISSGPGGVEVTSQRADMAVAVRHLRVPEQDAAFAGTVRRTILPIRGNSREMIAWNIPEAKALGEALGIAVRVGDNARLGVTGASDAFTASAVAVAAIGMGDDGPEVDFLHSKLAPPKVQRIPRWTYSAAALALIAIGGGYYAYTSLQQKKDDLATLNRIVRDEEPVMKLIRAENDKVTFARAWHGGDPRYLGCLDAVTRVFPDDGAIFSTSLSIKEPPKPTVTFSAGKKAPPQDMTQLLGQLNGKAGDQRRVQAVLTGLKGSPAFTNVQLVGTNNVGRTGEVTFSITFTYKTASKPTS